MRASDADRDWAAQVLREAAAEGRLTLEELDDRLTSVYSAKTYAELEPTTRDLPASGDMPAGAAAPAVPAARFGGTPGSSWAVGILGGFQRRGGWVVPRKFTSVAFCGGGQIDLRDARFAGREVTIRVFAVMGGVHIIVPPDAEVDVNGVGVMGGFDSSASGAGSPGGPKVVIKGFAFWGGVGSERKPSDSSGSLQERG